MSDIKECDVCHKPIRDEDYVVVTAYQHGPQRWLPMPGGKRQARRGTKTTKMDIDLCTSCWDGLDQYIRGVS